MKYFTTSLMKNLLTNKNNFPAFKKAFFELFRSKLENSINEILEHKLTLFLDYTRSDNPNYRNRFYLCKFNTRYGILYIRTFRWGLLYFFTKISKV